MTVQETSTTQVRCRTIITRLLRVDDGKLTHGITLVAVVGLVMELTLLTRLAALLRLSTLVGPTSYFTLPNLMVRGPQLGPTTGTCEVRMGHAQRNQERARSC